MINEKPNTPTLTIMCGLPRSGKSSWIKANKGSSVIVSSDEIRKEIFGHQFHSEANKFVFAFMESMVILLLKHGESVIADATHLTYSSRFAWKAIADKYGAKIKIVWVYIQRDRDQGCLECLVRNKNSPKDEQLPEEVIKKMSTFFQEPTIIDEEWAELVEYRNS